jgi:hypothetical protein
MRPFRADLIADGSASRPYQNRLGETSLPVLAKSTHLVLAVPCQFSTNSSYGFAQAQKTFPRGTAVD